MTGNAQTGAGDHQFIRLLDRATGTKEIHPSSDDCVIVDINGVYQHDDSYFVEKNKLCFFDTVDNPPFGSIINVKVLKGTEVAPQIEEKYNLEVMVVRHSLHFHLHQLLRQKTLVFL